MPDYISPQRPWASNPLPSQVSQDPLADAMRRERDEQIRQNVMSAQAPEQVAKATVMARQMGTLPADVDGLVSEAERSLRAGKFANVAGQYPSIAAWAASNPRDAAAASGDHKPLGIIGSAWDTIKKLPATGVAAFHGVLAQGSWINYSLADIAGGLSDTVTELTAPNTMTVGEMEARKAARRAYWLSGVSRDQTAQQAARPQYSGYLQQQILQGLEQVPSSGIATLAGVMTRSPGMALTMMGVQTGAPAYGQAREAGKNRADALRFGIEQGGIEALTEKIPATSLVDAIAKKTPFGRALLRQLGEEIPNEQVATALQDLSEWANLNPEKPFSAYVAERPQAALSTLIQTAVGTTAQTGAAHLVGRAADVASQVSERMAQADEALQERTFIDAHAKAATESTYRQLDPEGYANMVGFIADQHGASSVFLNPEAVQSYQQSDSYDQYEDPFKPYQAQIDEALATGGDVVLPASFALGTLPGTVAWSAVKDDMRLQPGGMSAREAEDFNARMDDVIKELSDQRAQIDQGQAKERDARTALVERVTQMLQDAGFTPTNANLQAELIAQRAAVRAARLGRELQPGDFDTRIISVLPPALAEMQKADRLDLVINAMRKGKSPTDQGGKTLLEWIAARGGINDTGGDIAAMGGDKWHLRPAGEGLTKKGRKKGPTPIAGRSKLIRDYDPRQATMGGISGQGDFGIDSTMRAAVEAGYFPHLAGENVQSLDTNDMLAAIRDELAGNPTYAEGAKVDDVRLAADELRQMLADRGLDPEGMSDAEVRTAVKSQMEEDKAQGRELHQSLDDGARGRITLPVNGWGTGPATIELFQSRNPSTLLHELSHQWLEELRHDAGLPDAPEQLKADWQTVQDWFKANGHTIGDDGVIPTEAHELWARGGELYLMEGKAPSPALRRLFETLRSWMVSVYRTVQALRAPITPEIREVLDRLVATDEEIRQVEEQLRLQPLFTDAAAIGMTGEEFAAYTRQVDGARDEANAELLRKTMAVIRRQRTKAYNDQRKAVWQEEADRLDNSPVLKSLRLMRDTPVSLEWLQDRMGRDVTDLLPKRVPPLWKEGGANPDAVAEMAGFESGQQMIEVLIGAESQHRQAREGGDQRTLRARMIDNAADEEMRRQHGDDPFSDGSIEAEAIGAVNNELAGELLATEIRALSRRTGQRPTPYKIARQWARDRVRQGIVAEEAKPGAIQRHSRAVAKAGREAEEAMLKGDMPTALAAKQRQMLSSALLAESKAAYDEVNAAQERLGKVSKRATMKSVDQDYLDQAHALMDAVDLGPRSQRSISRQGKWEQWAAAREAEGFDVVVPASFEATIGRTHWSRLTVENLLGLDDAVKQVMHLGRLKQTLLDNQEQREWDAVFDEAVSAAGNISGPPPADLAEPGWLDGIKGKALALDAGLLKMETVFDWLDGGDTNGVFNRIVFRPISNAQAQEQDMLKDYLGRIKDHFEAVPADALARWNDILLPPFTDVHTGRPMRVNRQQVIAMALNVGNEGNLQRLVDGYRVPAAAVEKYLSETLTAEEWKFVQGVWDTIDTLWPMIEGLEKRVNGVAPEKIEPRAFDTPHGSMRGGYYPAVYDTTRDYRAEENRGRESDLLDGRYTRATTRASSTKERAEQVKRPILLDLGVINRHLGEVIHDISHREAVIQANRFLTSERVMRAVDEALGPEIRKQFRPWLKFVANSWAMERAGNEGFGKWIGKLRSNATAVGMGLRATTMVTQIAGYSNSVEVVGEAAMAQALARFTASPVESTRFVMERSDEIRHRMDTLDRDIRTELAVLASSNPVGKAARQLVDAKRFMFHGIGYMDRVVSVPTWMAAYSNAIEGGMEERDAAYAADKAVRQSQGAGAPKDLAAIQRGTGKWGEALKLFTMFYSYFSAQYQRQRTLARDIGGVDQRRSRSVPKLASRAFFLLVLPPLLTEVLHASVGASAGPDDDEWWAQWAMRKLIANALGPIPMARDLFEPAWQGAIGGHVFNPSISPLQRVYDSMVKTAADAGKIARGEKTKHATKDVLEAAGYATGLVPGQVASATQFLVDVGNGDANPKDVADWIEGISTGKIKE